MTSSPNAGIAVDELDISWRNKARTTALNRVARVLSGELEKVGMPVKRVILDPRGRACTDGETVWIPARIDDDERINRMAQEAVLAHEAAGHLRYTDFKAWKKVCDGIRAGVEDRLLHDFVNILEDARVNHLLAQDFIGSGKRLDATQEIFMQRHRESWDGKSADEIDPRQASMIAMMTEAIVHQPHFFPHVPAVVDYMDEVRPICTTAISQRTTAAVIVQAKKMLKVFRIHFPESADNSDSEFGMPSGEEGEGVMLDDMSPDEIERMAKEQKNRDAKPDEAERRRFKSLKEKMDKVDKEAKAEAKDAQEKAQESAQGDDSDSDGDNDPEGDEGAGDGSQEADSDDSDDDETMVGGGDGDDDGEDDSDDGAGDGDGDEDSDESGDGDSDGDAEDGDSGDGDSDGDSKDGDGDGSGEADSDSDSDSDSNTVDGSSAPDPSFDEADGHSDDTDPSGDAGDDEDDLGTGGDRGWSEGDITELFAEVQDALDSEKQEACDMKHNFDGDCEAAADADARELVEGDLIDTDNGEDDSGHHLEITHRTREFIERGDIEVSEHARGYAQVVAENRVGITTLVNEMRRLIKGLPSRASRMLKKGQLDSRRLWLHRTSNRLFQKRLDPVKAEANVVLLIDSSGSMGGTKAEEAAKAAVVFTEVFNQLGFGCEVIDFASRGNMTGMRIRKSMNAPVNDITKAAVAAPTSGGNNADGYAVQFCLDRLAGMKGNRMLFVISDGQPAGPSPSHMDCDEHLIHVVANAPKDISVFSIGIQGYDTSDYYPNNVCVVDSRNLIKEAMPVIRRMLRQVKAKVA